MKRTIEEHLANIRANAEGMKTNETRARIRRAKINATLEAYRQAKQPEPEEVVVMPAYVDAVIAAEDDLIRKVITVIACVDELEAKGAAPVSPGSPPKAPGAAGVKSGGSGKGGGGGPGEIVDPESTGGPAGGGDRP